MSIIQEALKKAERQIKDAKAPAASPQAYPPSDGGPQIKASAPNSPVETRKASGAGSDPRAVAILISILVVAAVVAASQLFPKKDRPGKPAAEAAAKEDQEIKAASKPAAAPLKNEEFPTLAGIVFQKTQPEAKSPPAPEFVLNGIMYLEGNPRAIINDAMVEVGDMVGGARVAKIEKKKVLLDYNGAEVILALK